jgi:hypothetical protein
MRLGLELLSAQTRDPPARHERVTDLFVFHPVLEVLDGAADAATELGQLVGAENQDDDEQNDKKLW